MHNILFRDGTHLNVVLHKLTQTQQHQILTDTKSLIQQWIDYNNRHIRVLQDIKNKIKIKYFGAITNGTSSLSHSFNSKFANNVLKYQCKQSNTMNKINIYNWIEKEREYPHKLINNTDCRLKLHECDVGVVNWLKPIKFN